MSTWFTLKQYKFNFQISINNEKNHLRNFKNAMGTLFESDDYSMTHLAFLNCRTLLKKQLLLAFIYSFR